MPSGRVIDFDEHVGLGHVTADDGTEHLFHCVEIADGTPHDRRRRRRRRSTLLLKFGARRGGQPAPALMP